VLTTERNIVAASRRFVESQLGEEVTVEHAKRLKKLYVAPQLGAGPRSASGRRSARDSVPEPALSRSQNRIDRARRDSHGEQAT
jgi:hypothetical protein